VNKELITILTVNYNTADFIDLMLYAFKKLTKNFYKVIICDNGSNDEELVKLAKVIRKYENIEVLFRVQSKVGSVGHAEAVDILIDKVNTRYTVVMDSDCTFLMNNWDEYLISKLNDKIKIVGTPRQPKNTSNKIIKKIYANFPAPYAVLFDTYIYRQLHISCMPGNIQEGKDTVWEWRGKFEQAGYGGYSFDMINTRFNINTLFQKTLCAVYVDNNSLIASHFGRGSSGGNAKYKNWYYWRIPLLSKYLIMQKSISEKDIWINKSKSIINLKVE